MHFITHHKKLIALVAVFSFIYLVGISTMPLQANDDPQQPGAIEKAGYSGSTAKKSPIIPIIIGVVVVGAIAAVLILVVLKKKFDITDGTWNITWTFSSPWYLLFTGTVTFAGDKKAGTATALQYGTTGTGPYTVSGNTVTFNVTWSSNNNTTYHTGSYSDDNFNAMSGTFTESGLGAGTWTATRGAAASTAVKVKLPEKGSNIGSF